MLAQFSVIPISGDESLSAEVAHIVKIVRDSGLEFRLNSMGTVVEGEPDAVFELIRKCHMFARSRNGRVYTTVAIDDRPGKTDGRIEAKVRAVEKLLDS